MSGPDLPEAVLSAINSGDLTQLKVLYQASMSLDKIAQEAARKKQPQILEWCYDQGWAPPRESFNDPFFFAAITGESIAIFQVLLDHGWDLNAHESEACGDLLASAVIWGSYDFAKWLLEHGHRVDPHDPVHGPSSLSATVRGETASIEMLKLLLDHGCDLKESGAGVAAADEGNLEALRLLLDRGVDIEDREMSWYPFNDDEPYESTGTALYRACRQGQLECVKLLLDRGADAQAKDDGGMSCISVAKERGYQDVVKLLEERGVAD
jgi:ankyrin repeat protein